MNLNDNTNHYQQISLKKQKAKSTKIAGSTAFNKRETKTARLFNGEMNATVGVSSSRPLDLTLL